MEKVFRLLVINTGSTSTKIAVYENENPVFLHLVRHNTIDLDGFNSAIDQCDFRKNVILDNLKENGIDINDFSAVIGRGGALKPISSGTYSVNEQMLEDLQSGTYGQHASNLGGIIAWEIARQLNIPSYIADPIVVDELEPLARISGIPEIQRRSLFHALNQKAVARKAAKELGKKYEEINLIVAHMGGGITIGAHKKGRVIDVNNALDGEGPFTPERAGDLPAVELLKLCFSGKYTEKDMTERMVGKGGLIAYIGTNDGREVNRMIDSGDKNAKLIYQAMSYQVAKAIGAMSTVLFGEIDAVVLTGGLAYDDKLVGWISDRIAFIAPVLRYPGEDEMTALAEGALRILRGEDEIKEYL